MKLVPIADDSFDIVGTNDYGLIFIDDSEPLSPQEIAAREVAYRDEIIRRVNAHDALVKLLKEADILFENLWKAVPWGDTFNLDVGRLNTIPARIKAALAEASETRTEGTPDAKQGTQGKGGE